MAVWPEERLIGQKCSAGAARPRVSVRDRRERCLDVEPRLRAAGRRDAAVWRALSAVLAVVGGLSEHCPMLHLRGQPQLQDRRHGTPDHVVSGAMVEVARIAETIMSTSKLIYFPTCSAIQGFLDCLTSDSLKTLAVPSEQNDVRHSDDLGTLYNVLRKKTSIMLLATHNCIGARS